jgi:hypothetical protein
MRPFQSHPSRLAPLVGAACLALVLLFVGSLHAATITIVNLDDAGEGFNDPTPAAPVGNNPATTRGAQALYVFQYAANIWGSLLPSTVQIRIEANFDPLDCDSVSGVLGSAGPNSLHADFPNAPFPGTLYHQALANRLAGSDLDASNDIGITFNSAIGGSDCLPQGWYFGVDGEEGSRIELLPVVLHEMGHGLGFSTSTFAGVQIEGLPHVYDRFLFDATQGMHWNEMSEPQRVASAQNCQGLAWDGANVVSAAPSYLGPKPVLRVDAPASIAGDYEVGLPSFGPAINTTGVSGSVVLALDGAGVPTNGCEPFTNAAEIAGNIALIDRGGCTFVQKVLNAQSAGAIGVIVADSTVGCPPAGMGGIDPSIVIPSVRVTQADGLTIKTGLLQGLHAALILDPALRAGADAAGRVLVYTPIPFALGSSVSHWCTSTQPNLLMEPALNPELSDGVDLALQHFADIGWFTGTTAVEDERPETVSLASVYPNPARASATVAWSLAREAPVTIGVYDLAGRLVRQLASGTLPGGTHTARWDGADFTGRPVAAGVYVVRLQAPGVNDSRHLALVR